jgi:Protein of unknown function (DUF2637)
MLTPDRSPVCGAPPDTGGSRRDIRYNNGRVAEGTATSAVRITTVVAVSVVATVAGAVSYMHMHQLAERAGEGWRAWLVPLAVDGLVVAASMTMVVRRRAGKSAGWLSWLSMLLGITASLAANVAAANPTLIGRAVAAWPPLALLLAYELLMDQVDVAGEDSTAPAAEKVQAQHKVPARATPGPEQCHAGKDTAGAATAAGALAVPASISGFAGTAFSAGLPVLSRGPASAALPPSEPFLMAVPDNRGDGHDSVGATRHAARQYYDHTVAEGMPCTGRELADMFGMSERWGRYQIRAARRGHTTEPQPAPG